MSNLICRNDSLQFGIVTSIIIGVIAAALAFTGVLAVATNFYWVALGIAVGFLAVTLIASPFIVGDCCVMSVLPALSVGIIGTSFFSLILLGTELAVTSILGALLFGILVVLLFLTLISVLNLIKCIIK